MELLFNLFARETEANLDARLLFDACCRVVNLQAKHRTRRNAISYARLKVAEVQWLATGNIAGDKRLVTRTLTSHVSQIAVVNDGSILRSYFNCLDPSLAEEHVGEHHVLVGNKARRLDRVLLEHGDHQVGLANPPFGCPGAASSSVGLPPQVTAGISSRNPAQ